jgi:hypothetical protein
MKNNVIKQDRKQVVKHSGELISSEQKGTVSDNNTRKAASEEEVVQQDPATGKERGKYRQYEDTHLVIEKIRSYRTQRYPDSEIMKLLDNMPRRTYYNFVKKLQEQDREILEQWITQNVERVSEELLIHREMMCHKLREIQAIIDNKNTSPRDMLQAIEIYLAISEKLVTFNEWSMSKDMYRAKPDYDPREFYHVL